MSTIPGRSSPAAQRAQQMREAWQRAQVPMSRGFGSVSNYFLGYPAVPQGVYYLIIGLWPWLGLLLSHDSSRQLTGLWSGLLTAVIGVSLCVAGARREG